MTTSPDAQESSAHQTPVVLRRHRLRASVYGTLMAMSVLAYLGDHDPGPGVAALTVAGTGVAIFLAETYGGVLAGTLTGPPRSGPRVIRSVVAESTGTALPGILAGVLLGVMALTGLDVALRIDITLWVGVAALAVLSVLGGRAARRRPAVQVAWAIASLLVGASIVLLKAALH
ncbi:hypothetical protein EV188_105289 [Actinomycetospora succinea]|uniref:Uncharacterized protein n=1 Tax=Actinomycetospora succinea TaxID=663603 RepID=A0A4R6V653_9PSEU|nr:hypothetical protein [Actinomycetospora succinea]TDQ55891.1 hypothetical protein EV188_105289 [Actinomycetospora succinea]